MRLDELHPLEALLVGDFRSIEPRLFALDKHLTLRTYLDGYTLGDIDTKIWLALRGNRAALSFLRKGTLTNLTRWFVFIEHTHPEIQADVLAKDAEAKAKIVAGSKAGGNYNLALQDAEKGVVTRFLPEPSGYLHIGHVKAALLSDYFAHVAYKGTLRLRLDDTNPSKEKEEYQDAIIEDLALMGVKTDVLTYTSDYFDYLYEMCKRLISEGLAYADDTDKDTMQKERREKIKSKRRDLTVEENLKIFDEMKEGTKVGLENCIRAKISYDDVNGAMRDPVIYRCNIEDAHHRLGRKWKMYPTYDFACPVIDSHEGVTHALRSTEYTDRNPQYQWFLDTLKLRPVYMFDFARINFVRTFMSKRKLAKLVDTGKVWGWDDPRMPTVRGIRRRGMTIPALREFILKQGPSRNVVTMDWSVFWAANKKENDPVAPRHVAIAKKDAVKVKLIGASAPTKTYTEDRPKHPKNKAIGTKKVAFGADLLLDHADAKDLKVGEEITLMAWGNAFVRSVASSHIELDLHLEGDVKKTEKKITWLAADQKLVTAEVWDFDYLITKDKLEEDDKLEDFLTEQTAWMEESWVDEAAAELKADDIIQLERKNYCRVDKAVGDSKEGKLVLFCIPTGGKSKGLG